MDSLLTSYPTEVDGCAINAHFANILDILRGIEDAETNEEKALIILQKFYFKTPKDLERGLTALFSFLSQKEVGTSDKSQAKGKQQVCFWFDSKEIYADFVREYSIDLKEIEFLHWHKFVTLLNSLSGQSALTQKVNLRFFDSKELKGKKKREVDDAKKKVQIPKKADKRMQAAVDSVNARIAEMMGCG